MTMFNTPVEPRRLTLNAPHATPATVWVNVRLYRRKPTGKTWRCDRADHPLYVPPFAKWTPETVQLLVQEIASWSPAGDEPLGCVVVRVELVGWCWRTSARYPRLRMETRLWRVCLPLEQDVKAGKHQRFSEPMLQEFERLHARSPFVVSTAR